MFSRIGYKHVFLKDETKKITCSVFLLEAILLELFLIKKYVNIASSVCIGGPHKSHAWHAEDCWT